ncbi:MAG: hypothetical protein KBC26_02940 [Candidatus Pacebacteria bacterium]|nr:hypothetical protein [Candidatus Paceibacterota bacterium]
MGQRLFTDIQKRPVARRTSIQKRIILERADTIITIPVKKIGIYAVISLAVFSFVLGLANAPINKGYTFAASSKETERAELESQLKELEKQIAAYEGTVSQYKTKGKTLESEIKTLNSKIAKLNLQVKAITLNLKKLDEEIGATKQKIIKTEDDITVTKKNLSAVLQTLYENEQKNTVEMIMNNPKLSDFFLDVNNLLAVQEGVRENLEHIVQLKSDLMDQKEALAAQFNDVSELKAYQEAQQKAAKATEEEKKSLLKVTKGQESKYQQLLTETKKTAAQIRSRIFKLLGGGELSFGEAYKLAKAAQDATGVRAALILAVIDKESALARNVGRCKYDTAMHPTRDIPLFLKIMEELDMDPQSVFVSCPIKEDGAYGGAMGPAQFIPSTWGCYSGYVNSVSGKCTGRTGSWSYDKAKDRIGAITGITPSSPWNNQAAFIATAFYLKDVGAASGSLYDEKVAAARYYAGGNWRTHLNGYGARVVERAQEFQEDIDVLNK